jgi:hypothetical protein
LARHPRLPTPGGDFTATRARPASCMTHVRPRAGGVHRAPGRERGQRNPSAPRCRMAATYSRMRRPTQSCLAHDRARLAARQIGPTSAGRRTGASTPSTIAHPHREPAPWLSSIDAETLCQLWTGDDLLHCSSRSIAMPSITSPLAIALSSSSDSSYKFRRCTSSASA